MLRPTSRSKRAGAILCAALLPFSVGFAQVEQVPPPTQAQTASLPLEQIDDLVAPVALYPDPLLSEVLAASTYPVEVVEAQQWLQQNRNLTGQALMDAAKQQNWDPSVAALVAFPDALALLNNDIHWTTDLGNAFLAQQSDVMAAIQRMRAQAQANGKLANTQQQTVTTETQGGQSAIEIQPANPDVMYVPEYAPEYVWGPPEWGAYPDLGYPSFGFGFGFGPPIYVGGFFPGWAGWGGWGWGCGWFGGGLFVNAGFFGHYGFHGGWGGYGRGFGGRMAWAHDPAHRWGAAYPNRGVAARFGGAGARAFSASRASSGWRSVGSGSARVSGGLGSRGFESRGSSTRGLQSRGFSRSAPNRSAGNSSGRSFGAPRQNFSAPRSFSGGAVSRGGGFSGRSFSGGAARSFSSGGARSFSSGGARSFGGGARSFSGGGGRSFGGGHAGGGGRR